MIYLAKWAPRGHESAVIRRCVPPACRTWKTRSALSLLVGIIVGCRLTAAAAVVPGDADCNGVVNHGDVAALIGALVEPTSCAGVDANGDGRVTAADLVAEVTYVAALVASPTPSLPPSSTPSVTV